MKVQIPADLKPDEKRIAGGLADDFSRQPDVTADGVLMATARMWCRRVESPIGFPCMVIQTTAEVAVNANLTPDFWGPGTANLDVWIDGIVEMAHGFLRISAYLSDIWGEDADRMVKTAHVEAYGKVQAA